MHAFFCALRAFFRFVENEEVSEGWRSPTCKVKASRVEIQPIEGAPLEDFAALLDTGARVTEFLLIDLGDIDAGTILLKHTKGKRPREVYLLPRPAKPFEPISG